MIVNIQDDILKLASMKLLDALLIDKSTKKNILWATDAYETFGELYAANREIVSPLIIGSKADLIKTRARKALEQQNERTKRRGEVFTPLWICNKMNDYFDELWKEQGKMSWQAYVDTKVLEITCGEAPFLVSRYDVESGEAIPVPERRGLLDRKLRTVTQNTNTEEEWLTWALRAFQSIYGYEYQGDNLLIARVNLVMSFEEHLWETWRRKPTVQEYKDIIRVVVWNIWQMDGLTKTIPNGALGEIDEQTNLFELLGLKPAKEKNNPCRVFNWRGQRSYPYQSLPVGGNNPMKFDFVIGNPPYQDETVGEQKTFAPPIYHLFLEEAYKVADRVELIHPARFLFNAGSTPKAWNQKMLNDPHLKVLFYEQDSSKVFQNTDIKGGVAVTYRSANEQFGAIKTFTAFPELNSILEHVSAIPSNPLSDIIYTQTRFDLDKLYQDYPEFRAVIGSDGKDRRFRNNIFEKIPIFLDAEEENTIKVLGISKNKRIWKHIKIKYVDTTHENLYRWKVLLPRANGSGAIGEVLSTPLIGAPLIGHTQSFISIGAFETEGEAVAALKYLQSKFCRAMLGILKVTQDNDREVWRLAPLQDFTEQSDLDWTGSVKSVDAQLYKKYGLSEEEIAFIESHVKEME